MALLDPAAWRDRIFSDGWTAGAGGVHAVREPATDAELGSVGLAAAADVDAAVERAERVRHDWAATPGPERAQVLLRAAALLTAHADEVGDWIVRESGSARPKAALESGEAARECTQAAALTWHPPGRCCPPPAA